MSKKGFILNAILYKCPKCQHGDLFTKPIQFTKPIEMPKKCPSCSQLFEPEPGFYFGAMFLSYIMSGFVFLGIVGFCILGLGMTVNASMMVLITFAILIYIPLLRFSRALWINLMVKYDADALKKSSDSVFEK